MTLFSSKTTGLLTAIILFFFLTKGFDLKAQQLPARSPFDATGFLWNPAMTAFEHQWEAGVAHHQEWVGFEDAPQTTAIYGQYPFQKQSTSIGGFLLLDEIKPIRNNMIALTYAYKLGFGSKRRKKTGPRKEAQLSIGLMLAMNQVFIQGADYIVQDPNDPLQPVGELNELTPNIGTGVFFASKPAGQYNGSYFFAGIGTNQLLAKDLFVQDGDLAGNLRRSFHSNASIGYHSVGNQLTIEPSFWFNTAGANILNSQFNLKFEHTKAFWAALHYSLNQTLGVQLGYKLPGSFGQEGQLRIGIHSSFNMGGFGAERGLGYGFYLAYQGM